MTKNNKHHIKSRSEKHASYPERFVVPDNMVSWSISFPGYDPIAFNAPVVLDKNTPWADPQDISTITREFKSFEGKVKFSDAGIPLNPIGRTGLRGRGVLGKWGANFAVDGIVTTLNPDINKLQVLTIQRSDTGEIALPGGMVDDGETEVEARNRELEEELSIKASDLDNNLYEKIVYKGYVDDPRNTDNAWMETTAIHTHMLYEKASGMKICAGDDASDYKWITITPESISCFYANHGITLLLAVKEMIQSYKSVHAKLVLDKIKLEFNL